MLRIAIDSNTYFARVCVKTSSMVVIHCPSTKKFEEKMKKLADNGLWLLDENLDPREL